MKRKWTIVKDKGKSTIVKHSRLPYFLEKTPRPLFISALPQCGGRLFEGGYYSKYRRRHFISALPRCGDYSRAAPIYFSATAMRRLFEGGYYSRCGVYSRKYGIPMLVSCGRICKHKLSPCYNIKYTCILHSL